MKRGKPTMNHKQKKKGRPPMELEAAKRLLEEKTNEPFGRELAGKLLLLLQSHITDPDNEDISTMLYALEHTKHTMLLMAHGAGYEEAIGPLLEAARVVSAAALRTVHAMAETYASEPN